MIVGIDPGHGGDNHGCRGNNLAEESMTLIMAGCVRDAMMRRDPGTKVLLTREHDETVHFAERARRLAGSDFVMSLHFDSAEDPATGRLAAYCFEDDPIARAAGERIRLAAPAELGPGALPCTYVRQKDWTERAYNVLVHHRPTPCLLVEVGFLSNTRHVAYFNSTDGMAQVAQVLCDGLGEGLLGVAKKLANAGNVV